LPDDFVAGREGTHRMQTTIFRDYHAAGTLTDENGNARYTRRDKVFRTSSSVTLERNPIKTGFIKTR
jgi:hypothetical protein